MSLPSPTSPTSSASPTSPTSRARPRDTSPPSRQIVLQRHGGSRQAESHGYGERNRVVIEEPDARELPSRRAYRSERQRREYDDADNETVYRSRPRLGRSRSERDGYPGVEPEVTIRRRRSLSSDDEEVDARLHRQPLVEREEIVIRRRRSPSPEDEDVD
ncbi:hypothetical protein LTS18_008247, partial [Coniosporium uncinatum]